MCELKRDTLLKVRRCREKWAGHDTEIWKKKRERGGWGDRQEVADFPCWVTQICKVSLHFQKLLCSPITILSCVMICFFAFVCLPVCVCVCMCLSAAVHSNQRDFTLLPLLRAPPASPSFTLSTNTLCFPTIWISHWYHPLHKCVHLSPSSRLRFTLRRISWFILILTGTWFRRKIQQSLSSISRFWLLRWLLPYSASYVMTHSQYSPTS